MQNKKALLLLSSLSFLGFLDATYLTIQHYQHALPPCTMSGCETVLTSKYATIFGISIALPGALYYLSIFILSILLVQKLLSRWQEFIVVTMYTFVSLAFIINGILFLIQAMVIHAFCQYCIANELITAGMFGILIYINVFRTIKQ